MVIFGATAWPLAFAAIAYGVAAGFVFSRLANQAALGREKRRIQAHLLEIWLFAGEPRVIWRAQLTIIRANLHLMALLFVPTLVLAIPTIPVLAQLDAVYGRAPLRVGHPYIVTAQLEGQANTVEHDPRAIDAPAQIEADRPSVFIPALNQISWRIRPLSLFSGKLRLQSVEKDIVSGEGPRYVSARATRNAFDFFLHPTESRLPAGPVRSVEILYPRAEIRWFGLQFNWLIWFLLISTPAALAVMRR